MKLALIVAMDENGGIGYRGGIPWHLRTDLKRFKALTMGHHLLVGRKTFDSIGAPLPGRDTIVITRDPEFRSEGVEVVHSLNAAIDLARLRGEDEAFVIGGGEIYRLALPLADRIYFTRVHTIAPADVFFPPMDLHAWESVHEETFPADEHNDYAHTYRVMQRPRG